MSYGECKCNKCDECLDYNKRVMGKSKPEPGFQKYQYQVLGVCQNIAAHLSGSGDPFGDASLRDLVAWLEWRVNHNWDPPHNRYFSNYDFCVKQLALEAVALYYNR